MDTYISPENVTPFANNNETDLPLTDFEIYETT